MKPRQKKLDNNIFFILVNACWSDLRAKLNSELLNNLGNLINLSFSFIIKPTGWLDSFIIFLLKCLLISSYKSLEITRVRYLLFLSSYCHRLVTVL